VHIPWGDGVDVPGAPWQGYSFLDALPYRQEWLVPGSGKEAPKVLPWVNTLIANIKGNIRGVLHGVSPKHLPRYLAEFCYRFNRRFWEPQMFNRLREYLGHYILGKV
jgi:hypothetical protein